MAEIDLNRLKFRLGIDIFKSFEEERVSKVIPRSAIIIPDGSIEESIEKITGEMPNIQISGHDLKFIRGARVSEIYAGHSKQPEKLANERGLIGLYLNDEHSIPFNHTESVVLMPADCSAFSGKGEFGLNAFNKTYSVLNHTFASEIVENYPSIHLQKACKDRFLHALFIFEEKDYVFYIRNLKDSGACLRSIDTI
jgi:hypothetical protein